MVWTAASGCTPLYAKVARCGSVTPFGMFFRTPIFPNRRNSSISAQVRRWAEALAAQVTKGQDKVTTAAANARAPNARMVLKIRLSIYFSFPRSE